MCTLRGCPSCGPSWTWPTWGCAGGGRLETAATAAGDMGCDYAQATSISRSKPPPRASPALGARMSAAVPVRGIDTLQFFSRRPSAARFSMLRSGFAGRRLTKGGKPHSCGGGRHYARDHQPSSLEPQSDRREIEAARGAAPRPDVCPPCASAHVHGHTVAPATRRSADQPATRPREGCITHALLLRRSDERPIVQRNAAA